MNDTIREYCSSAGDEANDVFERICAKKERIGIDLKVQLIQELIKARKEKGLTQKELGKLCGLPLSSIARLENGIYSPSLETISKVLRALEKRVYIGKLA